MNMLRAIDLLKQDIKEKENANKISMKDEVFFEYGPITPNRLIHFYGAPDCGKTTVAIDIMKSNIHKSFVYISKNPDNLNKVRNIHNCSVFTSNIFEITLLYLRTLEPGLVDFVIIDDIHNMISQEELNSAFSKRLNNKDIFDKYIKQLSLLAAQKKFNVIVFNGLNQMNDKSRYSYLIEKEAIATFKIEKTEINRFYLNLKIIPEKNIMNNNRRSKSIRIHLY